ncbi:His/Gly/Thr/Pro-type tRNA ligase C-terminal domain-containing protein [Streptomyces sp. NPDC101166]|uniref:His/Gly/Thr/Pro-type tRNA ligase C-terminal domain-containing protein n=1 Tax=Streptomyces sp. NPDC101166 TaxID=3366120 RepID=UPI0038212E3C
MRTSALLSGGLLAHLGYPGLPTYTAMGRDVLDRIEYALAGAAERSGFSRIHIPSIMKDSDLEAGQEVGEQFLGKILFLSDMMSGYHLMTSPEMLLTGALVDAPLSHRDLPVRASYLTDIFRQMKNTRSILRLRQFRVLGGLALTAEPAGVGGALQDLVRATVGTLDRFGLRTTATWRSDPLHVELFCASTEGSTNVPDPASLTGRTKALSLAIGYHYGAGLPPTVSYRSSDNTLAGASVATYALCTNRVLYAVFDQHRDSLGFALPAELRPFDVVVVPSGGAALPTAERLYDVLVAAGVRAALDDRVNRSVVARHRFADYVGAAVRLEVSCDGQVSGRLRGGTASVLDCDDPVDVSRSLRRLLDDDTRQGSSSRKDTVPCPTPS